MTAYDGTPTMYWVAAAIIFYCHSSHVRLEGWILGHNWKDIILRHA